MPSTDLTLVTPSAALARQFLEWRHHPDVRRWLLRTTVDADELVEEWARAGEDPARRTLVAVLDGRAVGVGSLRVRDGMGQVGHEAEFERREGWLGFTVDPAYAGRGIATSLAQAVLDLGFGELGLRRVSAGCFADNTASWRVMEKLGMRREQHGVRDSFHSDLGWVDGYTYAILADEWRTSR